MEGEYKVKLLEFLKQHYITRIKDQYVQLTDKINKFFEIAERRELETEQKEMEQKKLALTEDMKNFSKEKDAQKKLAALLEAKQNLLEKNVESRRVADNEVQETQKKMQRTLDARKQDFDAKVIAFEANVSELKKRGPAMTQRETQQVNVVTGELSVEETIMKMIDFFASSPEVERNMFLSFWQSASCLDKNTGFFAILMPKSAFENMSAYHLIQQNVLRLEKEILHLKEAEKLLLKERTSPSDTSGWSVAIIKAARQALIKKTSQNNIVRTSEELIKTQREEIEKELVKLKAQKELQLPFRTLATTFPN